MDEHRSVEYRSVRRTYIFTYLALLALLAATVGIAFVDLGALNTIAALAIACLKAVLVAVFFMHVRHSGPATRIFVGAGLLWLLILIGLTLTDYLSRAWGSSFGI
jgi:cytochrome c oxidase subunit 4